MSNKERSLRITCFRSRRDIDTISENLEIISIFSLFQGEDLCTFSMEARAAENFGLNRLLLAVKILVGDDVISAPLVTWQPVDHCRDIAITVIDERLKSGDIDFQDLLPLRQVLEKSFQDT